MDTDSAENTFRKRPDMAVPPEDKGGGSNAYDSECRDAVFSLESRLLDEPRSARSASECRLPRYPEERLPRRDPLDGAKLWESRFPEHEERVSRRHCRRHSSPDRKAKKCLHSPRRRERSQQREWDILGADWTPYSSDSDSCDDAVVCTRRCHQHRAFTRFSKEKEQERLRNAQVLRPPLSRIPIVREPLTITPDEFNPLRREQGRLVRHLWHHAHHAVEHPDTTPPFLWKPQATSRGQRTPLRKRRGSPRPPRPRRAHPLTSSSLPCSQSQRTPRSNSREAVRRGRAPAVHRTGRSCSRLDSEPRGGEESSRIKTVSVGRSTSPGYLPRYANYGIDAPGYQTLHKGELEDTGMTYTKQYELPTISRFLKAKHPIFLRARSGSTTRRTVSVSSESSSESEGGDQEKPPQAPPPPRPPRPAPLPPKVVHEEPPAVKKEVPRREEEPVKKPAPAKEAPPPLARPPGRPIACVPAVIPTFAIPVAWQPSAVGQPVILTPPGPLRSPVMLLAAPQVAAGVAAPPLQPVRLVPGAAVAGEEPETGGRPQPRREQAATHTQVMGSERLSECWNVCRGPELNWDCQGFTDHLCAAPRLPRQEAQRSVSRAASESARIQIPPISAKKPIGAHSPPPPAVQLPVGSSAAGLLSVPLIRISGSENASTLSSTRGGPPPADRRGQPSDQPLTTATSTEAPRSSLNSEDRKKTTVRPLLVESTTTATSMFSRVDEGSDTQSVKFTPKWGMDTRDDRSNAGGHRMNAASMLVPHGVTPGVPRADFPAASPVLARPSTPSAIYPAAHSHVLQPQAATVSTIPLRALSQAQTIQGHIPRGFAAGGGGAVLRSTSRPRYVSGSHSRWLPARSLIQCYPGGLVSHCCGGRPPL